MLTTSSFIGYNPICRKERYQEFFLRRFCQMADNWMKEIHFERCPRCGAVVMFKKDSDVAKCEKCGAKIKLKKQA